VVEPRIGKSRIVVAANAPKPGQETRAGRKYNWVLDKPVTLSAITLIRPGKKASRAKRDSGGCHKSKPVYRTAIDKVTMRAMVKRAGLREAFDSMMIAIST
jgi:hypothetical protein